MTARRFHLVRVTLDYRHVIFSSGDYRAHNLIRLLWENPRHNESFILLTCMMFSSWRNAFSWLIFIKFVVIWHLPQLPWFSHWNAKRWTKISLTVFFKEMTRLNGKAFSNNEIGSVFHLCTSLTAAYVSQSQFQEQLNVWISKNDSDLISQIQLCLE